MSNSTFHGMLHRTCTNGPMTAVAMQHRIDVLERSVKRHASKCEDAQPVCGQTIASMCI